jgi:rhodanese-related sulfurtransferase
MRNILELTRRCAKKLIAICHKAELGYVLLLVIACSALLFVSQSSFTLGELLSLKEKRTQSVQPGFESIELNEVLQYHTNELVIFIDSRIADQYQAGHIPGALNIPGTEISLLKSDVINKFKESPAIVVYCNGEACPLAAAAAQSLVNLGLDNVKLYAGGWPEWHSCGLPIAFNK